MKILVIGLGNPILGDDGVGWVVAQEVAKHPDIDREKVEVDCLALGGLSLMERLIGYEQVILIDSLNTGQQDQGSVMAFNLGDLDDLTHGHASAAHDATLKVALETGRRIGASLPKDEDVHIVAIESRHVYDFGEQLSPPISASVPNAINKVLSLVLQLGRSRDA